jgi:hypothetical protein
MFSDKKGAREFAESGQIEIFRSGEAALLLPNGAIVDDEVSHVTAEPWFQWEGSNPLILDAWAFD